MNEARVRVGNPYELDWEEEDNILGSPLSLPRRSFNELSGLELISLPPLEGKRLRESVATPDTIRSPYRWDALTREYLVSFAWLAFYLIMSIAAAAISLFFVAHKNYFFLPASILASVSFAVLALIRLSIHVREHRHLANNGQLSRAA
jgi:hypothetical protein